MDWLDRSITGMYWIAGAGVVVGAAVLVRFLTRCRHPNPHFEHAVVERNPATGMSHVVEPARYHCYECGKIWAAETRDPAWAPTPLVQKFEGYDEGKAVRAARRASIAQDRRRVLAAERTRRPSSSPVAKPAVRQKRAANVVDLNSRKPA